MCWISSVQSLSHVWLFATPWTTYSMPDFPVCHQLPELYQTHVHWVGDDIQPSHPLSSPSLPVFNLSWYQGLFQWAVLRIRWPQYWSFSFSTSPSNEYSGLISWISLHVFVFLFLMRGLLGSQRAPGTSAASLQMFFVTLKSSTPSLQRAVAFSLRIFEFSLMLHKKFTFLVSSKNWSRRSKFLLLYFLVYTGEDWFFKWLTEFTIKPSGLTFSFWKLN